MKTFPLFLRNAALWTVVLLVLLVVVSLLTGQSFAAVKNNIATWAGLALVLSAFPAGISVAHDVLPDSNSVDLRSGGEFLAGVAILTVVTALLVAFVTGPANDQESNALEPSQMTLTELRTEAAGKVDEMVSQVGIDGLSLEWIGANILVWHYVRRLAAIAQPSLFAVIGLLLGFWGLRLKNLRLRQLVYWAVGFFLVFSTYLAGENSFELVVLQAAGPVFFAGFFVLIIPPVLVMGLGIPTAVDLLSGSSDPAAR